MKKNIYYLVFLLFFVFLSKTSTAQQVRQVKAQKQLTNGVSLTPKLQKAIPTSVLKNPDAQKIDAEKPTKHKKPVKTTKYSTPKNRKDEE